MLRSREALIVVLAFFLACTFAYGEDGPGNLEVAFNSFTQSDISYSDQNEPYVSSKAEQYFLAQSEPYLVAQADTKAAGTKTPSSQSKQKEPSMDEMAKQINNPLADLWMLVFQEDLGWWEGNITNEYRVNSTSLFQPVLSIPLGDKWNLITRPIFMGLSLEVPDEKKTREKFARVRKKVGKKLVEFGQAPGGSLPSGGTFGGGNFSAVDFLEWDRVNAFGDFIYMAMIGPNKKSGFIWGLGLTTMWPTASVDLLGSEKYSAGPAAVGLFMKGDWVAGAMLQHWWSYAGNDDRDDVNQSMLQYFIVYDLGNLWSIGMSPVITANWEADSDDRWTVPIGFGIFKMVKLFGLLPAKIGVEFQYAVIRPKTYGMHYQLRFVFVPIIPNMVKMAMK